ncbi:UPF0769 protein C21orf59 [Trichoplax sp. H2]|uniref:Cilia- and flagella-associated protein 298 n=1 Tax=Trichoplax adhaerens TaxID=10228 RepID=B3RYL1_TRIAD|nr:hypothetical protein TRIADDRAFT_25469 [Trichoplax adhaerens]EDV24615.1 hypothetical protein TRIADDRAFT_25469 [Trichoplax adhaerens]RDD42303.1 UPF0769 protein C21orf59 [Trichoplax sp. H2]|eukprot:XP_002112505.1 hypothetical protein TRIADDRAFT_25469 [Trichoplax adhaerens]
MVKLHIKFGDESQYLFETTCSIAVGELLPQLVAIYNGRLKIERLSSEIENLAEYGIALPPNMQGLADEQIEDLKLVDEWATKCYPSGGSDLNKDPMSRRSGNAPKDNMKEVLKRTVSEVKNSVSKTQVAANVCITEDDIQEGLRRLQGAVTIVYPMGLPPHDPIKLEFENKEDLSGQQAALKILENDTAQLWWAGKEMQKNKKLGDYIGKNEKTKIIAKLQKRGLGAPAREPVFSEEEQKKMMAFAYRRQEQMKKLDEASQNDYLNSQWSDPNALKRNFHNLNDVSWRPH